MKAVALLALLQTCHPGSAVEVATPQYDPAFPPLGGDPAPRGGANTFMACNDPAADNNQCTLPKCIPSTEGCMINSACRYSCLGVLHALINLHLKESDLGFCLMPDGEWPAPQAKGAEQRTLRMPTDKTSIIQGIRVTPDEWHMPYAASPLLARVDVRYGALVLRHVQMADLKADEQRTSFWYEAGGALYVYQSNVTIHNSIFRANSGVWGGAIAMMKVPYAEISSCSFLSNSVYDPTTKASYGGAIHVQESEKIWIGNSEFSLNTARSGGAIMVSNCESFRVVTSTFLGNSAQNYAGAVEVSYSATSRFEDCTFIANTVGSMGGAVAVRLVLNEWFETFNMGGCQGFGNKYLHETPHGDRYTQNSAVENGLGENGNHLPSQMPFFPPLPDEADNDPENPCVVVWQGTGGETTVKPGCLKQITEKTAWAGSINTAGGRFWPQLSLVPTAQVDCKANDLSFADALPGSCDNNNGSMMPNHGTCVPACPTAPLTSAEATCELGSFTWNNKCADASCAARLLTNSCKNNGKCWVYDVSKVKEGADGEEAALWKANAIVSATHLHCACTADWTGEHCDTPAICETPLGPRCQNGGVCTAEGPPVGASLTGPVFGWSCECDAGWSGATCETDVHADELSGVWLRNPSVRTPLLILLAVSVLGGLTVLPVAVRRHKLYLRQLSSRQRAGAAIWCLLDGSETDDDSSLDSAGKHASNPYMYRSIRFPGTFMTDCVWLQRWS